MQKYFKFSAEKNAKLYDPFYDQKCARTHLQQCRNSTFFQGNPGPPLLREATSNAAGRGESNAGEVRRGWEGEGTGLEGGERTGREGRGEDLCSPWLAPPAGQS